MWAFDPISAVIGAVCGLVVLVPAALLFRARRWGRPVARIVRAAHEMAEGNWDVRVGTEGSPAIREVAVNLNAVAAQAHRQLADLQQQRAGLKALVDTLPDAILAADGQGRITLINAPAATLLALLPEQALREKLVGVVSDEQIVELYEELGALQGSSPAALHRELRLVRNGQRYTYQAVATRTASRGALVVLRDVTTLAGAVQMKTDFVANASHELRTPIAAIKIAFETLREVYREDPIQSERCIAVIDGHLKRLEEMLRDLLDLSRVESAEMKPHVAAVKITEIFSVLRSALSAMARQREVDLVFTEDEPDSPVDIQTDSRVLNLVLKNLVENSIKFTPAGGKVTVCAQLDPAASDGSPAKTSEGGGAVSIVVKDTGIGIAPEHLDRVFERFYQVDAARSGSAGRGTGLGLAIVKHAVNALGGTVQIQSTVGAGTTVTCRFPQPHEIARKAESPPLAPASAAS